MLNAHHLDLDSSIVLLTSSKVNSGIEEITMTSVNTVDVAEVIELAATVKDIQVEAIA